MATVVGVVRHLSEQLTEAGHGGISGRHGECEQHLRGPETETEPVGPKPPLGTVAVHSQLQLVTERCATAMVSAAVRRSLGRVCRRSGMDTGRLQAGVDRLAVYLHVGGIPAVALECSNKGAAETSRVKAPAL